MGGDVFLAALALELETTQRVLPSSCLFCVPQARSLAADARVPQEALFAHILTPAASSPLASSSASSASSAVHRPGAYETLNGKAVSIVGSHVLTGAGFDEKRKVRILLSDHREVANQQVLVLFVSRPLVGGLELPEDPNEIDMATFRRYTAMLRAFPENELVFLHLDETIAQAAKICRQNQFANRYETTLPAILREEWAYAVDEIARGGSLDEEQEHEQQHVRRRTNTRPFVTAAASHLLQIQQVVECYLMEQLHAVIFPRVMVSCRDDDEKLGSVLWQLRHYGPADFGLRKEFQCYLSAATNAIVRVERKKTPLEMLLAFKQCIDHIHEGATQNLRRHHHNLDGFQMTTDDILDELLYVLVQAYNHAAEHAVSQDARAVPYFPMISVLKYVSDYHFINSNTSMLGYTIANFQVAIEYFVMKATHAQSCRLCYNIGSQRRADGTVSWQDAVEQEQEQCPQAILPSAVQAAFARNYAAWVDAKERTARYRRESVGHNGYSGLEESKQRLVILGDWSDDDEDQTSVPETRVHEVEYDDSTAGAVTQVACGHRFFAIATEKGRLLTWGDPSGGRLGYAAVQGDPHRVMRPRLVPALASHHILQVACGAFHTLVTDVNGHVYAWGQNAKGQLGFLTHLLDTTTVNTPMLVTDLKGVYVSSVACGEYHSLGLSSEGLVFSWGCNKFNKLGRPTEGLLDAVQPKAIESRWTVKSITRIRRGDANDVQLPTGAVRRIAAGRDHSVVVTFDGAVFTWGRGDHGQLGHGSFMDVPEPKQVIALADDAGAMKVMDVSAGGKFTLFLLRDGAVFVSGQDPSRPDSPELLTPELVVFSTRSNAREGDNDSDGDGNHAFITVAAGESHFALATEEGEVFESSSSHDTDDGTEAGLSHPRQLLKVSGLDGVIRVRAGASHTLVLCDGG